MNANLYNQLYNLIVFIITGTVIGILFDMFRIIRKTFKTPDIITYIQDIIFWILTGCILLFTIFTFNNGKMRNYVFIGVILGVTIYLLTLSKYFVKINVIVVNFIKKIIYIPIKIIFNFFKTLIIFIYNKIKSKKSEKDTSNDIDNHNLFNNHEKINQ